MDICALDLMWRVQIILRGVGEYSYLIFQTFGDQAFSGSGDGMSYKMIVMTEVASRFLHERLIAISASIYRILRDESRGMRIDLISESRMPKNTRMGARYTIIEHVDMCLE